MRSSADTGEWSDPAATRRHRDGRSGLLSPAVATLVVGAPGDYDLHLEPPPPLRGPVVRSVRVEPSGAELAIELDPRPAEAGR